MEAPQAVHALSNVLKTLRARHGSLGESAASVSPPSLRSACSPPRFGFAPLSPTVVRKQASWTAKQPAGRSEFMVKSMVKLP